jgi:hypothetical protein
MSTLKFLPEARWTTTVPAPRAALNEVARPASERQLSLAAENAPIRITYGRDRLGAQIANVLLHQHHWVVQCVWGEGRIDAVESVTFSDQPPPSGVQQQHYTGTAGQTVNSWLVSAFAAKGVTYGDALPGIAYSVFRIPVSLESDWSQIAAVIRGRRLHDPRTGTTAYSSNPALALADYLSNAAYGAGLTVDWSSVAAAANACDEAIGGHPRRRIGLTIDSVATVDHWIEVLRTYAGCLRPVLGQSGWRLIPDRPALVARHFDHASGNILSISPVRKRGVRDTPTLIRLIWTDTSQLPWRDVPAVVALPGVIEGATPRRESEVRLPGIQNASQAEREAIERLNKLTLEDIGCEIEVFDDGLATEPGDVVTVSHPVGLTAKPMRVVGAEGAHGRYRLTLVEYDPAMYSNQVVTDPTFPDTSLPTPTDPRPPTGLTLTEELFQKQTGVHASRVRVVWTAPADYPFVDSYRITGYVGGKPVFNGTAQYGATEWPSPEVEEGKPHTIEVRTASSIGALSSAVSGTISPLGKHLPPGNVPHVTGHYAAGSVRLEWGAAIDIDIWRYEVRRVAVGGNWAAALVVDRVDGLSLTVPGVPLGTWDWLVRALDSVGNYSPADARVTVAVTLPQNVPQVTGQYVAGEVRLSWQTSPTADIVAYEVRRAAVGGAWDSATVIDRVNATALAVRGTPLGSFDWLVRAIDSVGRMSASEARVTVATLRPPNVTGFAGFEAGGEVRLFWNAVSDLGLAHYEIRYGAVGVSWANATRLNRVDTLRMSTRDVAAGTHDFLIVAINVDGFESATPARTQINVTVDSGAFLVDTVIFTNPTVSNMAAYTLGRLDDKRRWVTENGVAWGTKFANAMSTYTQPLASYGPVAASWQSEAYDFGMEVTGNWLGEIAAMALTGTVASELQLSSDAVTWQGFTSMAAKVGARFARLRASGAASSVIHVEMPPAQVRIDAIPRVERGFVDTLASDPALVQLANEYAAAQSLMLSAEGVAARTTVFDRVLVAPATGLQLSNTVGAGGGNRFVYWRISNAGGRVIQSGDHLEYDVFIVKKAGGTNPGGMEIDLVAAPSNFRGQASANDPITGAIHIPNSSAPVGQWFSRKHSLVAGVGVAINRVNLVNEADEAGEYAAVYRNIRITDGAGNTRLQLWTSGEPSFNQNAYQTGQVQVQCGPANSFLVYQFDAAGNQVAGRASWAFNGI